MMKSRFATLRTAAALGLGVVTAAVAMGGHAMEQPQRGSRPAAVADPAPTRPNGLVEDAQDVREVEELFTLQVSSDGDLRFDPALIRGLRVGDIIGIEVPGGGVDRFEVTRARRELEDDRWWAFSSLADPRGIATIAGRGEVFSGLVRSSLLGDGFDWELSALGPGRMRPAPVPFDLPGCGGAISPRDLEGPPIERFGAAGPTKGRGMGPVSASGPADRPARAASQGDDPDEEDPTCDSCVSATADLAFFYTPQVLEFEEERLEEAGQDPDFAIDNIAADVILDCSLTSQAMINSDLPFAVRAVALLPVEWEDEEDGGALGLFAGVGDGVMDEIHLFRDFYRADVCTLITLVDGVPDGEPGFCGVAYIGDGDTPGSAFNQLIWGCMGNSYVLAHELGHNLGCFHAAGDCFDCDPTCDDIGFDCCRPEETGPDTKAPWYSYGWRWVNTADFPACRRTIMAYGPGVMEPHFSNPDVQINGVPSGSPETDPDNRWADNARRIRETFPGTAAFYCEAPESIGDSGRLSAPSLEDYDGFGTALATDGIRMFVGASRHDALDLNSGAVFSFADREEDLDLGIPAGWSEVTRFIPEDLEQGERFGESIATAGDLLVVGAPYAARVVTEIIDGEEVETERHPLAGKVEIWARYGEIDDPLAEFCRLAILQPETLEANDLFGSSVAVSGDLIAVGTPLFDRSETELNVGAVHLFQRAEDDTFELLEVIEGLEPGDRFGTVVGMTPIDDVNTGLVVGTPWSEDQTGSVQPFGLFESKGDYVLYTGSRVTGALDGDRFGAALAAEEGVVVVGAPLARGKRGAASAYRLEFGELVEGSQLFIPELMPGDYFGASVACRGGRIAVGMPGRDKMSPIDPDEVLLDDVGGCVFYEQVESGAWFLADVFNPGDLQAGDELGGAVEIVADLAFVGAPDADDNGILSGVVYVHLINDEFIDCNENGVRDAVDIFLGESEDTNNDGIPDECEEPDCRADLNLDGVVDGQDLGLLFIAWGACPDEPEGTPCPADFDGDGRVDGIDLGIFCSAWGSICPPPKP